MFALRIILIPISLIYSLIIFLRNKFYDWGIFKSYKISKPVISIGNITTGGTGKTPLTIFIAEYFLKKKKKVGIISRGYKRKSKDTVIVSDGNTINENTEQSGDELILISMELLKHYKNIFFIAASSDRVTASKFIIDKFNPDLIILDDAFQHRGIKRDLDVAIIDTADYLKNIFLNSISLPSGNLREGFSNLKRADILIQNIKAEEFNLISLPVKHKKDILTMRYKTEYFMDYKNSILETSGAAAIIFSGIANDDSFADLVEENGIEMIERIKFPDHHNYTEKDINSLKKKYTDEIFYITTEKDFVKLKQFDNFVTKYPVYYLKLKVELTDDKNMLFNKLDNLIK